MRIGTIDASFPAVCPPRLYRSDESDHGRSRVKLIVYYQALITAATEAGLKDELRDPFPYFRVKPVIATSIALADFSWYDTIAKATTVLWAIAGFGRDNSEPQELLDDLDQGWRVG